MRVYAKLHYISPHPHKQCRCNCASLFVFYPLHLHAASVAMRSREAPSRLLTCTVDGPNIAQNPDSTVISATWDLEERWDLFFRAHPSATARDFLVLALRFRPEVAEGAEVIRQGFDDPDPDEAGRIDAEGRVGIRHRPCLQRKRG